MNNAVVGAHGVTLDISPEVMERIFRVNVFGPLFMKQETVPFMPRGGRIINAGSTASKTGFVHDPMYAASKAAMEQMTFALSMEVRFRISSCPFLFRFRMMSLTYEINSSDENMG